ASSPAAPPAARWRGGSRRGKGSRASSPCPIRTNGSNPGASNLSGTTNPRNAATTRVRIGNCFRVRFRLARDRFPLETRSMNAESAAPPARAPWFVRGDLDGFFGLALDNLVQLLLIDALCRGVLGFPSALVYGRILPGAAVSLLVGN